MSEPEHDSVEGMRKRAISCCNDALSDLSAKRAHGVMVLLVNDEGLVTFYRCMPTGVRVCADVSAFLLDQATTYGRRFRDGLSSIHLTNGPKLQTVQDD